MHIGLLGLFPTRRLPENESVGAPSTRGPRTHLCGQRIVLGRAKRAHSGAPAGRRGEGGPTSIQVEESMVAMSHGKGLCDTDKIQLHVRRNAI